MSEAQPIPQATNPTNSARPFISQTRGEPPSPYQHQIIHSFKWSQYCSWVSYGYRASVFALFTTSTDETGTAQLEVLRQASLSKTGFTFIRIKDWNVNFLQNVLEVAFLAESVLAPSSNPASNNRDIVIQFHVFYLLLIESDWKYQYLWPA